MISHIDAAVGRIVDALRETGQLDNTIIVFAGDNGLALGSHGLMGKQSLYDHSVRVPLVFAGPGIPEDERREQFCYLIDVFPTLCSLCGMDTPETVDGLDLGAALRDPDATVRDVLHTAYTDKHRAVRNRRYKLIEYVVEGERTTQLFDLLEDPHELKNLAEDPLRSGVVLELRGELERWRSELGDTRERFGQTFWAGYDNAR
jgi:arylsulfatase A-like enzyme